MAKKNFIITVVLMLLIVASNSFAAERYQWKLVDTDDGCQAYTSPVDGKPYIAAKATCVFNARIEVVGMVLRDIANFSEWMHDCKETKMLKVVDDQNDTFIFWFHQNVPLLRDRDMVLKTKVVINLEKGRHFIYADSTDEMSYDADKRYVRMPSFHSLHTLEWVDREHTRVTFMIDPDLGKGIPHHIANSQIKSTPIKTLKKMMKMTKLSKYIEPAKTSRYAKMAEEAIKKGYLKP